MKRTPGSGNRMFEIHNKKEEAPVKKKRKYTKKKVDKIIKS